MATGDDAANAGMAVLNGTEPANTLDTEINLTRDYIAQRTADVVPIAKGGTGKTTAQEAREALGVILTATSGDAGGKVPIYTAAGQLATAAPSSSGHAANKSYVDDKVAAVPTGVPSSGGTFTGNVFFPNSTAATSSYTVAYINGDGRLSRGASSERFKEQIEPMDPALLGDIWPDFQRFQMIGGDGSWKYGYIAERLAEHPDQAPFVVYSDIDGEPVVASIDFIALIMAQNAQLRAEVAELRTGLDLLAQRVTALEGGTA